jgi:SAM-dependent methyltransferase
MRKGAATGPRDLSPKLARRRAAMRLWQARASMYDRSYFDREYFQIHAGKRRYLDFLIAAVRSAGTPAGRLLDVGSGLGFFVAAARAQGLDAFGMDHALAAAARTDHDAAPSLIGAGDVSWPVPAAALAAVTLWDVIEHLADYRGFLAEAIRALAPGGCLFVITLNARSWARPLLGRRWSWYRDPTHLHLFSAPMLRRELSAAGFERIELTTIFNFCSVGEGNPSLRALRRIGRVVRLPAGGDSLLAIARRP